MAVDVESSIKFDALLQVTGYILQCFTSRFLLIPGKIFLTFPHFSLIYSHLLSLQNLFSSFFLYLFNTAVTTNFNLPILRCLEGFGYRCVVISEKKGIPSFVADSLNIDFRTLGYIPLI